MMDTCSSLGFGRVDGVTVLLHSSGMIWREKNLASLCCLSCLILRRAERITFFVIIIHFANDFVFNSGNSIMFFTNHLNCSDEMSLACY